MIQDPVVLLTVVSAVELAALAALGVHHYHTTPTGETT